MIADAAGPDSPATASKRPRGRPRSAAPLNQAERDARYLAGRSSIRLPHGTLAALDTLAQLHGDPSRAACVARLVKEAAG